MDVSEVVLYKRKAEQEILNILSKLEKDTGASIDKIETESIIYQSLDKEIFIVRIDLHI